MSQSKNKGIDFIQGALNDIKTQIENAIITGGYDAKNNLIRTQGPIQLIHNAISNALEANGINKKSILQEKDLVGLLKKKSQDIIVNMKDIAPNPEKIDFGYLHGEIDSLGHDFTEKALSINVRSQLSSLAKNFDTLYERTFAEALNLHLRCPKMVLGELYMIPLYEYSSLWAKSNTVKFELSLKNLEKYLLAFESINQRTSIHDELYKYEKICLLLVDFRKNPPQIYNSNEELIKEGLITKNSRVSIENLNFLNFIPGLISIYNKRF